jgi:hypothetical protein
LPELYFSSPESGWYARVENPLEKEFKEFEKLQEFKTRSQEPESRS